MELDDYHFNAPWLLQTCPKCLGEGHTNTIDFDTMEDIEEICDNCNGSCEVHKNPYDKFDIDEIKSELYDD